MSVAQRQPDVVARAGAERAAEVTVRWVVAASALTPGARGAAAVEIGVRRDGDGAVWVEVCVVTGEGRRVVRRVGPLEGAAWRAGVDGLEHVEAAPTLRATLCDGGVLFAQTDVLGELGIGGGRYDRPRN